MEKLGLDNEYITKLGKDINYEIQTKAGRMVGEILLNALESVADIVEPDDSISDFVDQIIKAFSRARLLDAEYYGQIYGLIHF